MWTRFTRSSGRMSAKVGTSFTRAASLQQHGNAVYKNLRPQGAAYQGAILPSPTAFQEIVIRNGTTRSRWRHTLGRSQECVVASCKQH
eukprot:31411-Eustigmatos_ZCMA.PRE.1